MKKIICFIVTTFLVLVINAQTKDTLSTSVKNGKLEVVKTTQTTVAYDYKFLINERDNIQLRKDQMDATFDKQLSEIETLIAEAKKGGLDAAKKTSP